MASICECWRRTPREVPLRSGPGIVLIIQDMALRNLKPDEIDITCQLMQDGRGPDEKEVPLVENSRTVELIHALIPKPSPSDFEGSLHRTRRGKVHRIGPGDGHR